MQGGVCLNSSDTQIFRPCRTNFCHMVKCWMREWKVDLTQTHTQTHTHARMHATLCKQSVIFHETWRDLKRAMARWTFPHTECHVTCRQVWPRVFPFPFIVAAVVTRDKQGPRRPGGANGARIHYVLGVYDPRQTTRLRFSSQYLMALFVCANVLRTNRYNW